MLLRLLDRKTSIEDLIRDIEKFESYMEQQEQKSNASATTTSSDAN